MGNAVDENDSLFFREGADEIVGTAAADEPFDFEEGFLARDYEAGRGEGFLEVGFLDLGGVEFDGDGLCSHLADLGSLDFVDLDFGLSGDGFLVEAGREQDEAFLG